MANPLLPSEPAGNGTIQREDINAIVAWLRSGNSVVTPNDNGTTQNLTVAQISSAGFDDVYHRSTGGATPTLTLPTVASMLALLPDVVVGSTWYVRIINNNSGTATIALPGGGGWTSSGTLTLATNTWRDFVISVTSLTGIGAATITSVGTGADS